MKVVLLFILLGVAKCDSSSEWDKFKRDYNKHYASPVEEAERREIFKNNVHRMDAYQQAHPDATFTMATNHLADRRIEELISKPKRIHFESRSASLKSSIETKNLPESLDWRTKGVIAPVRNEGLVGEIVTAMVSTELVETLHAIRTTNLVEGSVERVFDCCPQPIDAFECIRNLSGICRKNDYPTALGTCESNKCKPFTTFDKINRLTPGDENAMLTWMQDSTLWAEIDASGEGFAPYSGGVYDDSTCSQEMIDHVMQIVGYGVEEGKPYWLCKNSWGENWGDKGYIRVARGKNMCAIATVVVQVADTKPSSATRLNIFIPIPIALLFVILVSRISTV